MLGYLCFKFRSDSTHYTYFGCGLSWRRILLSETAPSLLSKAVLLQSATPFRDHSHQHFSTSYSEFLYLPAPHQSAFRVRPWLTMSADSFELVIGRPVDCKILPEIILCSVWRLPTPSQKEFKKVPNWIALGCQLWWRLRTVPTFSSHPSSSRRAIIHFITQQWFHRFQLG